jgi:protein-S-isoprenylcysteine O-methyltransferase Ste14
LQRLGPQQSSTYADSHETREGQQRSKFVVASSAAAHERNPLRRLLFEHLMAPMAPYLLDRSRLGMAYAWSGFAIMWAFWVSFVIFLCEPRRLAGLWPLPTIDQGGGLAEPWAAALVDLGLIALFGLQHSLMARPWFKRHVMNRMPPAFERCTYVHMANLALFALILGWQPIPVAVWTTQGSVARNVAWLLFALGWITLFLGAWSFGIRELLGIEQMRAWANGQRPPSPRLKTGWLYRWTRHPMYVGVLLAAWATPRMSLGHVLLALGLTGYVLIALRYEERDLLDTFGSRYRRWREAAN